MILPSKSKFHFTVVIIAIKHKSGSVHSFDSVCILINTWFHYSFSTMQFNWYTFLSITSNILIILSYHIINAIQSLSGKYINNNFKFMTVYLLRCPSFLRFSSTGYANKSNIEFQYTSMYNSINHIDGPEPSSYTNA